MHKCWMAYIFLSLNIQMLSLSLLLDKVTARKPHWCQHSQCIERSSDRVESSSRSTYCNWQCFEHDSGSRRIRNFVSLWRGFENYLWVISLPEWDELWVILQSAITAAILKEKQKLLLLPEYKLIVGVATRWNSALNMISRYLEQQPAIYAALTSKGTP